MSLHRTLAIVRKEFHHIRRDLRTLFLVTLSPAFLLFVLSYVFSLDVEQIALAAVDLDHSPLSRRYLAFLISDGEIRLAEQPQRYEEAESLLLAGRVDGVLVIPHGFDQRLRRGEDAPVQLLIEGMDPIAAGQTLSSLSARTQAFTAKMGTQGLHLTPLQVESRLWYNPASKALISMVPGLAAIVLVLPALALALALTREKETGTFEGLISTPLRGMEYLAGKVVAYLISGLVGAVLAWLVATLWFRVPFRGDFRLFLLLAAVYLVASMGLSLLVANFVASQQTAMFVVLMAFFVPSFFLTGLIQPLSTRSLASRLIAYALPTTHFIAINRSLFLKGVGLEGLLFPALALVAMGAGGFILSVLLFRKRL